MTPAAERYIAAMKAVIATLNRISILLDKYPKGF